LPLIQASWKTILIFMEHNNHNQQQNAGNGFLLGVIVGVLLTLLFTTKRGRAIFKEVLERGVEKFANLEELMRETEYEATEEDLLEEEGDDFIPAKPVEIPKPAKKEPEKKSIAEAPERQQVKESIIKENKESTIHEKKEEKNTAVSSGQSEEKPKSPRGKRWFRGLRKKS
jgi:hypothetical protein